MTDRVDFEEVVRAAGTALTDHRVADARKLLDAALQPSLSAAAAPLLLSALTVNAAALAQTTGDFRAAERYGRQLLALGDGNASIGLNQAWYRLRQHVLKDQLASAVPAAQRLVAAGLSNHIDPVRRAEVVAELAGLQAANGRPSDAIALYDMACTGLQRAGTHRGWLAEALFEQARLLLSVSRACSERQWGDLTPFPHPAHDSDHEFRRRAAAALAQAVDCLGPSDSSSPLAESITALQALVWDGERVEAGTLSRLQAMVERYRGHRMCDLSAWSSCELARLHLRAGDTDGALAAVRAARTRFPLQGFSPAREQLDYHESLAHRQRGDHRQALFAYQRYVQRVSERRLAAPVGLHDGSLFDAAARLLNVTRRTYASTTSVRDKKTSPPALEAANMSRPGHLTLRETQVLELMALGQGNRQIADRLRLSPHTVRNHVAVIFRKLGVRSRAQAVAVMSAHGGQEE